MTSAGPKTRRYAWQARSLAVGIVVTVLLVLICAPAAQAYVGPGAGFAVLSSFLSVLLASLQAIVAFLTWPIRQFFRVLRRQRAYRDAKTKRAVIIGFDGMDPVLVERFIKSGKLPNLARLRETGTFRSLATTLPPISPVAWSSFLTGANPGKHNIYDFLTPDRERYLPELSSARVQGPRRVLRLGRYEIPLGRPRISQRRKSTPFWHYLANAGISCSIIRVPITFPPEKFPGILLSGMCVPDVQGTQGTFSFHTTRPSTHETASRVVLPLQKKGSSFWSYVPGPTDTSRDGRPTVLRVPFSITPEISERRAQIKVNGRRISISEGKYSEWVELKFRAGIGASVRGICRFYLKSVEPDLELYVTPVNIDPAHPALPISYPLSYSVYLAKLNGLYSTLGLAEDTWALNDGFLDEGAFLEQCYSIHEEREKMFFDALGKTRQGVCICVFDITDRVQHMFWRHLDDGLEASAGQSSEGSRHVIDDLYKRMDQLIGRTTERMTKDDLLLVLSDHGFKAFERGVNLNSWLHEQGYLALKEKAASGEWFDGVDWTRTRAYALGLNGMYLNIKGRERTGIVESGAEAAQVRNELCSKLTGLTDPETSRVAILRVFDAQKAYSGPYRENAPDLIVGFGEGYRASWDSVQGKVTSRIFDLNHKAWSGDHCIDPSLVPGILFSNWQIAGDQHAIVDIAPTLLQTFGVNVPSHMDGKPWVIQP